MNVSTLNVSSRAKLVTKTIGTLRRATRRCGFTVTELIVAATLLVAVMSVVASLTVRSGRLWQDSRHYRLAIDELSNHIERLASLDKSRLAIALAKLPLSSQIQASLPNPVLSGESLTDEDGTRLVLHLAWDRLGKSPPMTLVGWIDPLPTSAESTAKEETP